jgi:WhiB family transcriptional regulator, redox-sensing transcriptional regulator
MNWRHRAVCKDEDPELFFPIGEEHTSGKTPTAPVRLQHAKAKTVCARCPVVSDCLDWAVTTGQGFGVSGGMTPDERRALKRRTPARTR